MISHKAQSPRGPVLFLNIQAAPSHSGGRDFALATHKIEKWTYESNRPTAEIY